MIRLPQPLAAAWLAGHVAAAALLGATVHIQLAEQQADAAASHAAPPLTVPDGEA